MVMETNTDDLATLFSFGDEDENIFVKNKQGVNLRITQISEIFYRTLIKKMKLTLIIHC